MECHLCKAKDQRIRAMEEYIKVLKKLINDHTDIHLQNPGCIRRKGKVIHYNFAVNH